MSISNSNSEYKQDSEDLAQKLSDAMIVMAITSKKQFEHFERGGHGGGPICEDKNEAKKRLAKVLEEIKKWVKDD